MLPTPLRDKLTFKSIEEPEHQQQLQRVDIYDITDISKYPSQITPSNIKPCHTYKTD